MSLSYGLFLNSLVYYTILIKLNDRKLLDNCLVFIVGSARPPPT
jgi:hypothetical protein